MILILAGAFIAFVILVPTRIVYGRLLSEDAITEFLAAKIDRYELNDLDPSRDIMNVYGTGELVPFVARLPLPILSKWYINDIGCIPRWSTWTLRLDRKRAELIAKTHG